MILGFKYVPNTDIYRIIVDNLGYIGGTCGLLLIFLVSYHYGHINVKKISTESQLKICEAYNNFIKFIYKNTK